MLKMLMSSMYTDDVSADAMIKDVYDIENQVITDIITHVTSF